MEGCRHQQARSSKGIEAFSLISKLKRMFLSSKTAKDAQWHELKQKPVKNKLSHLADGKACKQFKVGKNLQKMLGTLDLVLQPMVSIHLTT
jgi:hypothetical protein